jgi:hypothetical protein
MHPFHFPIHQDTLDIHIRQDLGHVGMAQPADPADLIVWRRAPQLYLALEMHYLHGRFQVKIEDYFEGGFHFE